MLTPHRFMDLNYSVLNVTSLAIDLLTQRCSATLDEILDFAQDEYSEINEQDVLLAVSFLYLLGKVRYCKESESVLLLKDDNDKVK
ncbi:TPA: hypothetical protein NJ528_003357 [Vibrio parahaemolyticus]|uniref:hypothetical protein n=1 Tax=Vibrio TaxID=662 RepID=UPI001BD4839C|nr:MULTISPECIES: hypothetical protein [Vibrio]HCG8289266.1 hypothetical protein [Vibrio parahaemolyticus]MBT0025392.1 hypothetical protein [Vibrio alginolyticus]MCS0168065.1 hypothetical protein [Vibrio alginolyticus]MDW1628479.1 hypothetical protein [Vibrio sp. Y176]HCG8294456.1 hypothetical protein [Vibrio parahaemolyticus]